MVLRRPNIIRERGVSVADTGCGRAALNILNVVRNEVLDGMLGADLVGFQVRALPEPRRCVF